ncbi:MAG TPA: DEAD/DEAH box helicase, partial [Synergistales bacterium]|nr:DEAD/DEAH box helicase [Synergistales bacterium]
MTIRRADLSDPVRFVKGVGPSRERQLANLGVFTAEDLLFLFPRRYEDRRTLTPLSSLRPGTATTVIARVVAVEKRTTAKKQLSLTTVLISDGQGMAKAVWFNRVGLENTFRSGLRVALFGKVELRNGVPQLVAPEFEVLEEDDGEEELLSIVPLYPATAGLHQKTLRRIVRTALEEYLPLLEEFLPVSLRERRRLCELTEAMREIHYPTSRENWKTARRRLVFDEFFLLQAGLALRRNRAEKPLERAPSLVRGHFVEEYMNRFLPFVLTEGQRSAVEDILSDMERTAPMNRLLQGDVGSGKTVVALIALLAALDGECQGALLAPTEILARQHFLRLSPVFTALGIPCALLTGSLGVKEKK